MMGREKGARIGPIRKVRADHWAEAFDRLRCEKNLTLADIAGLSRVSLRTLKYIAVHGVRSAGARYANRWTVNAIERAIFGDKAGTAGNSISELAGEVARERSPAKRAIGRRPQAKGAKSADLARLHLRRSSKGQRPAGRRKLHP